ncbi:hypothetical protein BD769DRAFT_1492604 [Suillus cothurnatus]|nr:hypothetical protein BD769DRAFT_1492604 [Suillus cothurnatus]
MRISFILVVAAAFKLAASVSDADDYCPGPCELQDCCPGMTCTALLGDWFPVSSMSNFLLTLWLTGVADICLRIGLTH